MAMMQRRSRRRRRRNGQVGNGNDRNSSTKIICLRHINQDGNGDSIARTRAISHFFIARVASRLSSSLTKASLLLQIATCNTNHRRRCKPVYSRRSARARVGVRVHGSTLATSSISDILQRTTVCRLILLLLLLLFCKAVIQQACDFSQSLFACHFSRRSNVSVCV